MKNKSLLFLFLILSLHNFSNSQINQQWKWVHPMPQGNTINCIKAFSSTEWIAVGDYGTFMKTTNSGTTWDIYTNAGGTSQYSKQGKSLYNAWFFNSLTGIVCGANGWIGRTTNGGVNWDSVGVQLGYNTNLSGIYFINSQTGFTSGGANIFKTTNGGFKWTSLPGVTGSVSDIYALDENNIYYFYNVYFAKTTNCGTNWTFYSMGLSGSNDALFINANTGFVCGVGGYISITTNAGMNWTIKQIPGSAQYYKLINTYLPYGIIFNQNFNGTAFPPAGWRKVNVLGSSIEWVRSTTAPHSSPASALILNDCNISTGGGLDWLISPQIQVNSGDSLSFWLKPLTTGFTDSLCVRISTTDTALSSFNTRVLYIADGAGYPSTSTWTNYKVSLNTLAGQNVYIGFKHQDLCGDGIFLDDISIISPIIQTFKLYLIGDAHNIYTTTNMGDNWTFIPILEQESQYSSGWLSLDINGSTMAICGNNGIFNVSTNNGISWTAKNHRVVYGSLYDVWCNSGTGKVWAVGRQSQPGVTFDQVLYSTNGGITFQYQSVDSSASSYNSICMLNENTGYICGTYSAIRKTTNGGTIWDSLVTSIPANKTLRKIDFVNANTGWVFSNSTNTGSNIWKTTNGGLLWTEQSLTDTTTGAKSVYGADMINENTGFCTNGIAILHMTTNGGINWIAKTPKLSNGVIYDVFMLTGSEGYACSSAGKLIKTTNQWSNYDSILLPVSPILYSTKWFNMNSGFIATSSGYILRTTNGGIEWEIMTTSANYLSNMYAKAIDTAFAVGFTGNILKLGRGPVGNTTWKNTIPSNYYLGQNYPNPFNPVTEFKFGLFTKGKVNLKVYDITGQLVETFFDNIELNAGTITVKFNGSNLASGVYFYTLFVDDNRIDTKKMILVK